MARLTTEILETELGLFFLNESSEFLPTVLNPGILIICNTLGMWVIF